MTVKMNAAVIDQPVSSTRQEWDISPSKAGQMKVAVVEQFGKPLLLREWDIPSPGAGQILIKTEACGVCHTDVHAWHGDWPVKPTLPFIPGHEASGAVVAVGSGVTAVQEGDRVGVPWFAPWRGICNIACPLGKPVCLTRKFAVTARTAVSPNSLLPTRITSP